MTRQQAGQLGGIATSLRYSRVQRQTWGANGGRPRVITISDRIAPAENQPKEETATNRLSAKKLRELWRIRAGELGLS